MIGMPCPYTSEETTLTVVNLVGNLVSVRYERTLVCNMEIWCECFGRGYYSAMKPASSYAIAGIRKRLMGGTSTKGTRTEQVIFHLR